MYDYKDVPVSQLTKVQKDIYVTIKKLQPVALAGIAKALNRTSSSLSSTLKNLKKKELVKLENHLYITTGNKTFKMKNKMEPVVEVKAKEEKPDINYVMDQEHAEWLRCVKQQRQARLIKVQLNQYT